MLKIKFSKEIIKKQSGREGFDIVKFGSFFPKTDKIIIHHFAALSYHENCFMRYMLCTLIHEFWHFICWKTLCFEDVEIWKASENDEKIAKIIDKLTETILFVR